LKINTNKKQKVIEYWNNFDSNGRKVIDLKRNESLAKDFDDKRIQVIKIIKSLINDFLTKKIDLQTFKSSLDSENKKNNHWGFSAIKGQMFFNQLVNSQNGSIKNIHELLISSW